MSDAPERGRPIAPDDLFSVRLVGDPQASPDGARVAYVVTRLDRAADDYKAAIWLVPTTGGEPTQLTSGAARDTSPRWSPDGAAIAFVSNRTPTITPPPPVERAATSGQTPKPATPDKPKNQIWIIPVTGGEPRQLTNQRDGAASPTWSPDGRTVAFLATTGADDDPAHRWLPAAPKPVADERIITTLRYRADGRGFFAGKHSHLWTIAAAGGEATQLTGGDTDDDEIAWSPDGRLLAFVGNRTEQRARNSVRAIYVVPATGGEVRPLVEIDASLSAPAWSPDGTRLAFLGHRAAATVGKNLHLWTVAAGGGEPTDHTAAWDRSFDDVGMSDLFMSADQRPHWSADGGSVLALASDRGATHPHRVDLATGAVQPVTEGARRIAGIAPLGDGRLVLLAGDSTAPFELAVAEPGGGERWLTDHNRAWRDEVELVPAEEIGFRSPAGDLDLQGWLLKPPGFVDGGDVKYPLIVQIHGGPHAMYGHALFHEMQLMAARGYVVLFSNPRGSAGYGETFTTRTQAKWGEADLPDILGGLDAVLARGFVDPARVGVTGGSYGGYLTNWAISHSDRFRAAVTQRCVSNFHSMYGTSDIGFDFGEYEFGGTPWADTDLLLRHSPISHVARMTTPLLIIHNEGDLRCPIEQAEQLFVALKRLGREVTFVRIPEEDHNLSRTGKPSRRLARLHHLVGWFDQHL